MKLLIIVIALAAVLSPTQAVFDILTLNLCVTSCDPRTVVATRYCPRNDMRWTPCVIECSGIVGGPEPYSCVPLCRVQNILDFYTYGNGTGVVNEQPTAE